MKYLVIILMVFGPAMCSAEFRVWTDKNGNSIEAELLNATPAQVSVQDKKGKVFKFHPTKLSLTDQTYLKTAFPPELDISFSKVQDRQKHASYYHADVMMSGEIVVKAKRYTEYSKSMKAVLIMVGEEQSNHSLIILDKVEAEFNFHTAQEFELKGRTFKMHEDKYDNSYGTKYKGYLAVVFDAAKQPIEIKASRREYAAEYAKITKLNAGDFCTKDFVPRERVRSY